MVTSCDKLDPNDPQACFLVPADIVAGVPIAFTSACSVNAASFSWSFGDGGTSTGANPLYTYSDGGAYTVSLTVTNTEGKTDEASQSIIVVAPSELQHSGTIDSDETWSEGIIHLVTNTVHVDGAILTIEPGAVILFAAGASLHFGYHSNFSGATLIANGTAEMPITFTSAAITKSVGDWDYIWFGDGASSASSMQYCIVEYSGGYSETYGSIHIDGSSVAFDNSSVKFSGSYGISLSDDGFFQSFTGNTLMENNSFPISVYGNYTHTIGGGNTITTDKGVLVKGDDVEQENAIWLKLTCPYVLDGTFNVESTTGAKLTINPGAEIRMGNSARIQVGYHSGESGTLIADGTDGDHIKITSSAPEVARTAGDWDYIAFYEGAGSNSSLSYCDISYGGGYSTSYGMIYVDGSSVSITHSSLMYSQEYGIAMRDDGSFDAFSDNTFEGNGNVPIEIFANYAHTIGTGNTFNTGPGIIVKGDDMEQADVTWLKQNIPYIVDGVIHVESTTGARLTIEPGTTVKFTGSSEMYVGYHSGEFGVLVADGEPENKITFTSGASSGSETAGDWDGIWFYDGVGNGTILDNCIVSYGGGYSTNSGNLNIKNEAAGIPEITNCQIENSGAYGIYMDNNANPTLTNNTFTNNASGDTNL